MGPRIRAMGNFFLNPGQKFFYFFTDFYEGMGMKLKKHRRPKKRWTKKAGRRSGMILWAIKLRDQFLIEKTERRAV